MTQQYLENCLIAGKSFLQALNTQDAASQFVKALELSPLHKEALICLAVTKAIKIKYQSTDSTKRSTLDQESVSYLEQSGAEEDYVTAIIVDLFKNSSNIEAVCTALWEITCVASTRLAHIALESVLKLDVDCHRIWITISGRSFLCLQGFEFYSGDRKFIQLLLDKALEVAPPEKVVANQTILYKINCITLIARLLRAIEVVNTSYEVRQALLIRAWELCLKPEVLNSEPSTAKFFRKNIKELKKKYGFSKPKISFWS